MIIKTYHDGTGHVANYNAARHVANVQKPIIENTHTLAITQSAFAYIVNGSDKTSSHTNAFDPNITMNDSDVLVLTVDADAPSKPLSISTSSSGPIVAPSNHTLLNNSIDSGTIKWYPGVGNTGTFHYRCATDSNFGNSIFVQASDSHSMSLSGVVVIPSTGNVVAGDFQFYKAIATGNVNDVSYTWSLSGATGNASGVGYGSKYRLNTTNSTGLAGTTETLYVNVSATSAGASSTVTNSGIVILSHNSG